GGIRDYAECRAGLRQHGDIGRDRAPGLPYPVGVPFWRTGLDRLCPFDGDSHSIVDSLRPSRSDPDHPPGIPDRHPLHRRFTAQSDFPALFRRPPVWIGPGAALRGYYARPSSDDCGALVSVFAVTRFLAALRSRTPMPATSLRRPERIRRPALDDSK